MANQADLIRIPWRTNVPNLMLISSFARFLSKIAVICPYYRVRPSRRSNPLWRTRPVVVSHSTLHLVSLHKDHQERTLTLTHQWQIEKNTELWIIPNTKYLKNPETWRTQKRPPLAALHLPPPRSTTPPTTRHTEPWPRPRPHVILFNISVKSLFCESKLTELVKLITRTSWTKRGKSVVLLSKFLFFFFLFLFLSETPPFAEKYSTGLNYHYTIFYSTLWQCGLHQDRGQRSSWSF